MTIFFSLFFSLFAPGGEKLNNKPYLFIDLPSYTNHLGCLENAKKVCKRRLSTKQYFNLEGEKKSWKSTSVHVQRLKFLVWKPRLGSASNSYNTGNFPYTPLPRSVYYSHSVSLVQCFFLWNFF